MANRGCAHHFALYADASLVPTSRDVDAGVASVLPKRQELVREMVARRVSTIPHAQARWM
ncbi:hypothetical protein PHLGIDRAFT_293549 [Phlebiopsis gigantea 11061_1 CR5-6]|uniref:Uncharacterized protein n=1 Tax=Phlebiopsis gigantea (strain 11061_1 CR5-6) TaxID=745531 RepID=A0A0C3S3J8_PHLG1|nr:hypothetical protein PHLGIDRAFT_293549 [Phlebiopsis gigantea 11061_1 CR5-6]